MKKPAFSLKYKVDETLELTQQVDQRTLAIWAIDCVERVMPYFEELFPEDDRPREAIMTLQEWIRTGEFSMKVIRSASLSAHAAAREVGEDNPARSVARAAGQAVATAHVRTHSIAAANYALQALHRASSPEDAESAVAHERDWQVHHLMELDEIQKTLTER